MVDGLARVRPEWPPLMFLGRLSRWSGTEDLHFRQVRRTVTYYCVKVRGTATYVFGARILLGEAAIFKKNLEGFVGNRSGSRGSVLEPKFSAERFSERIEDIKPCFPRHWQDASGIRRTLHNHYNGSPSGSN